MRVCDAVNLLGKVELQHPLISCTTKSVLFKAMEVYLKLLDQRQSVPADEHMSFAQIYSLATVL